MVDVREFVVFVIVVELPIEAGKNMSAVDDIVGMLSVVALWKYALQI